MTQETKWTRGPWFVSGVRFKMNGCEWHSVNRYDEDRKRDENIACVGYDPRTGAGLADARLIAAAPEMAEALRAYVDADSNTGNPALSLTEYDHQMERAHRLAVTALSKATGE